VLVGSCRARRSSVGRAFSLAKIQSSGFVLGERLRHSSRSLMMLLLSAAMRLPFLLFRVSITPL